MNGLLQVNSYSGSLQIKKSGSFSRRTTMVSLRWKTTVIGWLQMENVSGERLAAGE